MKLVGRIPVEPLDDERMTNIERRIVAGATDMTARPAARESRVGFVLAFALVTVLVLGAGLAGWTLRGGGAPGVVAEAPPVKVDTTREHSTIDIGDARISSDPATAFTVTRPDGGVLVAMSRGKVELEVGKRGDLPPLVVRAGDTDVVVIGTRFSVDYGDGRGAVEVKVTEGVVKVVRAQRETRVAAGESWRSDVLVAARDDAKAPGAPGTSGNRATIPGKQAGSGDLEIDMGHAPDVGLHGRTAKIPTAGAQNRTPTESGSGARPSGNPSGRPTLVNPRDPYADLKTAILKQPLAPPLDVGQSDPRAAIAEYTKLIAARGDQASAALYSIAYVQHMKLGKHADALHTLEGYRRRFEGGKEFLPALWLRVRISCWQQFDSACRQAAYTYAHAASGTPAAAIAERITTSQ